MLSAIALACALSLGPATEPETVDASAPAAPAPPAPAPAPAIVPAPIPAPPPDPLAVEYGRYHSLQTATGLDLSSTWERYPKEARPGEDFGRFARRRFRRKVFTGVGLSAAGLVVGSLGIALVLVAASGDGDRDLDVVGGAIFTTIGFSLAVPGGLIWTVNQVRLHKLRRAGVTARLLPGGAGLHLRLAF